MRFFIAALGIAISASLAAPAGALTIDVQTTVANVGTVTSCPVNVNFNAKIIVTGWPSSNHTLQYKWVRSDNAVAPMQTLVFPNGVDTMNVTAFWAFGKNASGWEGLEISYPSPLTSNRATFTMSCPIAGSIQPGISPSLGSAGTTAGGPIGGGTSGSVPNGGGTSGSVPNGGGTSGAAPNVPGLHP